ncbi:MAG: molybdenum ABC transporter permease subunit [Alphaproteobacteria bacterium 64-11]|nr:molybdate ABC transporter permease subunit [Alphaproteobacteria bacterium]OJU11152.1 MAG: molybdenum ABC transporter permease subunit [Alphaproteobacteria bacterium 64-11]
MISGAEIEILSTSFAVATRAILWSLPFAVGAAWVLSRPNLPGKLVLDGLAHLPLILPPVLVGFLLLMLLGRGGLLGGWLAGLGIHLPFTRNGAALATAVMAFPLFVRSVRLAFEATDRRLFEAAAMLRAGPWDRFVSIALPLAGPGILAGTVTAFAAALGEFGAVITFAANIPGQTQTLPLAIYAVLQQPGGEAEAMRLATLSILLALAGLALAGLLQRWSTRRHAG